MGYSQGGAAVVTYLAYMNRIQVQVTDRAGNTSSYSDPTVNGDTYSNTVYDNSVKYIIHDNVAPTMTISSSTVDNNTTSNNSTISLTFTSSEATDNFVQDHITITNGSLSNFSGSGTTYTATLTPSTNGKCTINVAKDKFTDLAGNYNTASDTFIWTYDSTRPNIQVVVKDESNKLTTDGFGKKSALTIEFNLNDSSNDFNSDDVTVSGGTLGDLTNRDNTYGASSVSYTHLTLPTNREV